MRLLNSRRKAVPAAGDSRRELAAAREEISKLKQALEEVRAELDIWYDNGGLLTEDDKMLFAVRYQAVKQQQRAEEQVRYRENQAELEEYLAAYREGGENDDPVI